MAERSTSPLDRVVAVGVGALLLVGVMVPGRPAQAAEPDAAAAARHLADTHGGSPNDYALVDETAYAEHPGAQPVWAAKFVDRRSGTVHAVYRDPGDGRVAGEEVAAEVRAEAASGRSALEEKGDAELIAAVAAAEGADADAAAEAGDADAAVEGGDADAAAAPGVTATASSELVAAGVWLAVDTASAEHAVAARHPELAWDGGMPVVSDLEVARAIRAELMAARAAVHATAFEQLRAEVTALGGTVAYESTSAPLAYVDMPAASVEALAALPLVATIGLERTWTPAMSSANPTVEADWTPGGEDLGAGVRVAVVEYHNVRNSGDLAGRVVASGSTSGALAYATGSTFDHPTWVAGAIAGQSGSFPGVAPGALIVSASTGGGGASLARDRNIIAVADWAASPSGGNADIVNASIGQDTDVGSEEARRYFDALVYEQGRLAVAAAGNLVTFGNWNIVSPGTAYNVLTVGGIDDRGTVHRGDDRVWYVPGSNGSAYHDIPGTAWNPHGDYNKPNVSAPARSVRTANGLTASGTSVSSPIVAGIAAQLLARAPALSLRPEGTRAIIMAGAINHTIMPDGSINADHEGTGTASALWANRLLATGDAGWGGHVLGTMNSGQPVTQNISVVAGQTVKVVVSWNSHAHAASGADRLATDMDLRVVQPNGSAVGSFSFDNNYEWVEFVASATGTARIELSASRGAAASERFGLAWAKTAPFWDIEASPFYSDIVWIAGRQITLGCGGGAFCPRAPVNREQMASFLVRAFGLPPSRTNHFDDDDGSLHEADINSLAVSGITLGCAARHYCPWQGVTREEMASFLVRARGLPPSSHDRFTDDNGSGHEAAINALAASGITNGCAATLFCPHEVVSREQMAAFLRRALAP